MSAVMDAAEIARLRGDCELGLHLFAEESLSLLDALEQAQKDAKDARALLAEALETYSFTLATSDLGDRIEAMLRQKL